MKLPRRAQIAGLAPLVLPQTLHVTALNGVVSPSVSRSPLPAENNLITSSGRRDAFRRMIVATTSGVATMSTLSPPGPGHAEPLGGGSAVMIPGVMAPYKPQGIGSWKDLPPLATKLGKSRILATELSPLQQAFLGDKDLYYPPFLFGAWNVKAELKRKIYPYGVDFLPSSSLLEGSPRNREELVGNVCNYEVHYFSTGNSVNDGKIIQDRSYNAISVSKAYQQLTPVQDVTWDYRNTPEKVLLEFGAAPLAPDMRPLGPRRAEIFINARATEQVGNTFATAERSRSVTVAVRDVIVADTETITEFEQISDDHVRAVSRIAVYLSPNPNSREGVLWQQTGGRAVAFFDYEQDMIRIKEGANSSEKGTESSQTCVTTPKGATQCT